MQRLLMFILQLNVTVTPVPGLPEGLTYNCSFSGSGAGFPLVVPAIELEAGTQYQCNITGRISDLSSIAHGMSEHTQRLIKCSISLYHAVTDFSFISVELGVPFATSSNALTIYNCSAAIRYDVVYVLFPGPYSAYFVTVVYTVWVQKVHVGGVFMEVFAAEDLTLVLYQKLEYSIPISRYTLCFIIVHNIRSKSLRHCYRFCKN